MYSPILEKQIWIKDCQVGDVPPHPKTKATVTIIDEPGTAEFSFHLYPS